MKLAGPGSPRNRKPVRDLFSADLCNEIRSDRVLILSGHVFDGFVLLMFWYITLNFVEGIVVSNLKLVMYLF